MMQLATAGETLANQPWWFQVIGVVVLIWFIYKVAGPSDSEKKKDQDKK